MKKTIVTIKDITGQCVIEHDSDGLLKAFKNEFEGITSEQLIYLLKRSVLEVDMNEMARDLPSVKAMSVKQDVTWEGFYEAYGYKQGKAKGEKAWNRLSKADRLRAVHYISTYERDLIIKPRAKLYPATYLNQRKWED